MTVPRTLVAALLLGSGLGLSCYSELPPPPAFRYACDSDTDCNADELCRHGLCERPCTQTAVFMAELVEAEARPCPFETYTGGCFNGACANTCELGSDFCPPSQVCVDVGLSVSSGSSLFGGGSSSSATGVCVTSCTDHPDLCTVGELCSEQGVCEAIDCQAGEPCNDGELCLFGACVADCSQGQACPGGYTCDATLRICTPDCNQECSEGFACYFGVCALTCEETADCPDPEGYSCVLGVCLSNDFDITTGSGTTSGTTTGDGGDSGTTGDVGSSDDGSSGGDMGSSGGSTGMGVEPDDAEVLR
ncbi:MAG: hypothetical protein KC501_05640 [Myxococcales bacterium]|nr:hypothetical protein [Myxococcales bacterium]